MPMSEEELEQIEEDWRGVESTHAEVVRSLVAEVRRLRGELDHIAEHLDAAAEIANQGRDGRSFGLRYAAAIVRDMREGV